MMTKNNGVVFLVTRNGKSVIKCEVIVSLEDADLINLKWNLSGTPEKTFRVSRYIGVFDGKHMRVYMHREIMERVLGYSLSRDMLVDHINGNSLDNRRDNLRIATYTQNQANRRKQYNNTSGYKGVYWNKPRQKWVAHISLNKKAIHLGVFDTAEEAHKAYCEAARKHHGEFANFGEDNV